MPFPSLLACPPDSALCPTPLWWGLSLIVSYTIGAMPMGVWVAHWHGVNIMEVGSGNTGGTNVWRTCGKVAGATVYLLDFLKALCPVLAFRFLWPEAAVLHVLAALVLIVGHSKSMFIGFRGGKSAMSSLGVVTALSPLTGLACALLAVTLIKTTRYVSVGSMGTALFLVPLMWLFGAPVPYLLLALASATLVILRHRDNIKRLCQGNENRI